MASHPVPKGEFKNAVDNPEFRFVRTLDGHLGINVETEDEEQYENCYNWRANAQPIGNFMGNEEYDPLEPSEQDY